MPGNVQIFMGLGKNACGLQKWMQFARPYFTRSRSIYTHIHMIIQPNITANEQFMIQQSYVRRRTGHLY